MLSTRIIAGPVAGIVLAALFATVFVCISFGDAVVEPWRVDPARPAPITLRLPRTTVRTIDATGGSMVDTVDVVIPRGTVTRDPNLAVQVRLHESERRPPRPLRVASQWFVSFVLLLVVGGYLRRKGTSPGVLLRTHLGLAGLTALLLLAVKALLLFTTLPAVMLPVATVALWTAVFVDRPTAIVTGTCIALLAALLASYHPITSAVYVMTALVAPLLIRGRRRSGQVLAGGLLAGAVGAATDIAATELLDGFELNDVLTAGWQGGVPAAFLGGVGSGVLALVTAPVVALVLGLVSRAQLLNLTDVEHPLLRKMAKEAPGSWEHARAMANLAEAAAAAIHADPLLTRVGAYFHDLGKTCQPKYFVENLDAGETSPHEELEPEVSADAIMAHVSEGTRILREGGIPEPIVEFAYTHHGTSIIEFFWGKCLKQGNPNELTEDAFRYPGMPPRTRETAILMLIDSIEAGARTVEPPSRDGFDELVRRVVFSKLQQGQLDSSGLTVEDLRVLSTQIVDTLVKVYHSRIRYPWQDRERESGTEPTETNGR